MPDGSSIWIMVIFVVIIILAFYFLLIRPQKNRQKEQEDFISQLKIGDDVYTVAGMYGKLVAIDEKSVVLETENGAEIRLMRGAIAGYVDTIEGTGEAEMVEAATDVEIEAEAQEIKREDNKEK